MNQNRRPAQQALQALAERKLVIFGSGRAGAEICSHLIKMVKAGDRVLGFMDSNPLQTQRTVMGLPVRPPAASEYSSTDPLVILAALRPWDREEMRRTCSRLGYEYMDFSEVYDGEEANLTANVDCGLRLNNAGSCSAEALYVDLVDSCNLHCVNCIRSHRMPYNLGENVMSVEIMRGIVDKAVSLGYLNISYYNWTEPFLHPAVDRYAAYAKSCGLSVRLSSNLSLPVIPLLFPALRHCSCLYVSVSGFTNKMHAANHRGSDIEVVKRHLDAIAEKKNRGSLEEVQIIVKFLDFGYNQEDAEAFRGYAFARGFEFEHVHGKLSRPCRESHDADAIRLIARLGGSYAERRKSSLFAQCPVRDGGTPLDYKGDVYLCCGTLSAPFFRVGNFLDDDFQRLRILRQTHPYCAVCGQEEMEISGEHQ